MGKFLLLLHLSFKSGSINMERHLFYKSQYPVLLVTRILGLTPFSIKITETKTVLQLSLPWLVYSIILFVGYLFAFATCLPVSYIIPLIRNYPFISVIGETMSSWKIMGIF